ncbi:hypothetical protein GCM10011519_34940 [Marmoricola endophyticus]|uniref:Uncharacterized protein n=1 Tax=Marmoricola endophyticus TaxID=2040280 RepID=A0A917FAM8_9ACTN|nr:hypothetical protein [Marmoricola endophyticus]GGF58047.1 hypothetical protein GCM10011519_34940 [Marmoricola endophyticus]
MLWGIFGSLLEGLFEPGPPTTERAARLRAAFALVVAAALLISGVVLAVIGWLSDDSDNRTLYFVLAGCCLLLAGLAWFNARRFVLDQREGRC